MNNTIKNPKVGVNETTEMNDENYLNCLLETEKNMSDNLSIALNEASNDNLYQKLKMMFDETKELQRELFELAFELGFYELEKAEIQKINQKYNQFNQKLSQLV